MIVSFPVEFEFRKTKVAWVQASARLKGWARRTDATVDGGNLMAEITPGGFTYPVRFPLKRLPEGRWEGLWLQAYTDEDVERVLSDYEPLLLVPSGRTYVQDDNLRANSQPADPWALREEFLRLEPSIESALAFLNKWGRWNSEEYVEQAECTQLQQAMREAMTTSPDHWFSGPYALPSDWRRSTKYPYFGLLTDKIEVALRMTVTSDLLNQAKFKTCARPDCRQPFKIESKHDKKFCSRTCAHVEAVLRSRKTASEKREK